MGMSGFQKDHKGDLGLSELELHLDDCLDVMKNIPDMLVDMVMADPPYGTTNCKWDSIIPLEPMWEQLKRVIKKNGAIVLMGSQPFTTTLISSNMKMFKYEWIWYKNIKTGSALCKKRPMKSHENILIFSHNQTIYNPQMVKRTSDELKRLSKNSMCRSNVNQNIGDFNNKIQRRDSLKLKYPFSVLEIKGVFNRSGEKVAHSTQKPVELMEYLIKTYTNEGDTVLDFCMGSGTTLVACHNLNRNGIGIEKDPEYFKIAKDRIDQATRQQNLFMKEG